MPVVARHWIKLIVNFSVILILKYSELSSVPTPVYPVRLFGFIMFFI